MYSESITVRDFNSPDQLAADIAAKFHEWNGLRDTQLQYWEEVDKYVHGTDTSNLESHFNHKTFIPVIAEVHEDLQAIMYGTVFPHNDWLGWQPNDIQAATIEKRENVLSFMKHIHSMNDFKNTFRKLLDDYSRYGNSFAQVVFDSDTKELEDGTTEAGYSGPSVRRISPYDIVFNPTVPDFESTPKIIRTVRTVGGFIDWVEGLRASGIEINDEAVENVLQQRGSGIQTTNSTNRKNSQYFEAGMTSIESFQNEDYVELLWFYGNMFDMVERETHTNKLIVVVQGKDILFRKRRKSLTSLRRLGNLATRS
jgi:hypothetical protein